jgi:lysophospholipase L1-like esterase
LFKKTLLYVTSFLAVILVFLVFIELATRLISLSTGKGFVLSPVELEAYDSDVESIYAWHPFVGFTFRPYVTFSGGHPNKATMAEILVDRYGFLAKDCSLTIEKPANEIRIATIGASTTANVCLSFEENWPGQLERMVQEALPGKKVRVINASVPGFDTAQSIGNLALRVMPFKPDLVIVYHAYNDFKAAADPATFLPDYSHAHKTPFGYHEKPSILIRFLDHSMFYARTRNSYRNYREQAEALDSTEKTAKAEGRMAQVPEQALRTFEEHFRTLVAISRGGNAKVVLSSFATLYDPELDYSKPQSFQKLSPLQKNDVSSLLRFTPNLTFAATMAAFRQYNDVLHKVASDEQTGWVDNASLVPHEDKFFVDRVHFSADGANRMAQNFLPVVLKMLNR